MKELENEMILDGLLTSDDLLGEELMAAELEASNGGEVSQERTISEKVIPISHTAVVTPASSQSPTSKRMRSPSAEGKRRSRRATRNLAGPGGPINKVSMAEPKRIEGQKNEPKCSIPKVPKVSTGASKKLKNFHGRSSPMKKAGPSSGVPKEKKPSNEKSVPQNEEENSKKSREVKKLKPKDGEVESRISPDPPE